MLTETQLLYMKEVLGALPTRFHRAQKGPVQVLVLTAPLDVEQRALLDRILATTQIKDLTIHDTELPARHILDFRAGQKFGRVEQGEAVRWCFYPVELLTGTTPEVTMRKREVWNLLQVFIKEFGPIA